MMFFKKVYQKIKGLFNKKQPFSNTQKSSFKIHIPEREEYFDTSNVMYVSINDTFKVFLKENNELMYCEIISCMDWKTLFGYAWVREQWADGTYSLEFPLFNKFVQADGRKESQLSELLKWVNPGFWHIPYECLGPIEDFKDPNLLLSL